MTQLLRDLRHSARALRASPGYTVTAVLTLALGIGANGAIFSLVDGLFLRPPAVDRPERLAAVVARIDGHLRAQRVSFEDWRDYRQHSDVFTDLAAFSRDWLWVDADGAPPREAVGSAVSGNYFTLLGVRPGLGRLLDAGDDRPGAPPVAVLSHRLWHRLGADPEIVGSSIRLNTVPFTVVGVAPPGFR